MYSDSYDRIWHWINGTNNKIFVETNVSGFLQYVRVTKKDARALAKESCTHGYGLHFYIDDETYNVYICTFKGRFERNTGRLKNLYIENLETILLGSESENEQIRKEVRRERS